MYRMIHDTAIEHEDVLFLSMCCFVFAYATGAFVFCRDSPKAVFVGGGCTHLSESSSSHQPGWVNMYWVGVLKVAHGSDHIYSLGCPPSQYACSSPPGL